METLLEIYCHEKLRISILKLKKKKEKKKNKHFILKKNYLKFKTSTKCLEMKYDFE